MASQMPPQGPGPQIVLSIDPATGQVAVQTNLTDETQMATILLQAAVGNAVQLLAKLKQDAPRVVVPSMRLVQ